MEARCFDVSRGHERPLLSDGTMIVRNVYSLTREGETVNPMARPLVQEELNREFFQLRFDKATPAERRYMAAMADLGDGPQSSDRTARHLGYQSMQGASMIRDRLMKKGLVYSPARGLVAFTVPHFADFIRRKFPLED